MIPKEKYTSLLFPAYNTFMEKDSPFSKAHALTYDDQWKKLAPMSEGLHFLTRIILKDLPQDAHILCVGAGTGSELMSLAQTFPQWKFTAVEPSEDMLDVCRSKIERAGYADRCHLHHGYLDTLPENEKFDASTAILVSQFLTQKDKRKDFFQEISRRLRFGGYLISADLTSPDTSSIYNNLVEVWTKALIFAGIPEEKAKVATSSWGSQVAVLKSEEIESIIASSGFEYPTHFYQSLFIHAWYAKADRGF